jgi:hypothetical protein
MFTVKYCYTPKFPPIPLLVHCNVRVDFYEASDKPEIVIAKYECITEVEIQELEIFLLFTFRRASRPRLTRNNFYTEEKNSV